MENREIDLEIYKMEIKGRTGHIVPIYFLSSNALSNTIWDRNLTKYLYSNDWYTRLGQEFILGVGGVKLLEKLNLDIDLYHMNEGHSALLTLELLRKYNYDEDKVRSKCTFTTHTPVEAGHDYFGYDLAYRTIGKILPLNIKELATPDRLGMTQLALKLSKTSNSVAEKHQEVCQNMFPDFKFENVTNGIYHNRWVGEFFEKHYDESLPGWQDNPKLFEQAVEKIPDDKLISSRKSQKKHFVEWINSNKDFFAFDNLHADDLFEEEVLTIGFARRFVPYKRPSLVFHNIDRLREIGYKKLQFVFASNCNPHDAFCNNTKEEIRAFARKLRAQVRIVVLPKYKLDTAKKMLSGCDIWLNNPIPPMEASGTSGMKACLNGCLNLSVLDGWWLEGFKMKHNSGWGFGRPFKSHIHTNRNDKDAEELYENLEDVIDCYYGRQDEWVRKMKEAISLLGFFNTHRVVDQYYEKIWE